MFTRKARCILLVVCVVIIICSVPIYLKVVKDAFGHYHVPKVRIPTFRFAGVKNEAVSGVKNEAVSGVKIEAVSGVKIEAVSGVKNEAVSGVKNEAVSEVKNEAVSGVKNEAVPGVKNDVVLGVKKNVSNVIARPNKVVLPPVPVSTKHNKQPPVQGEASVSVVGHPRERKAFLTIGILYNSLLTKGKSDLKRTLQSLIDNIPPSERPNINIVIVTSVLDATARLAREIVSSFGEHVQSGLLQLIEVPRSFYPADLQKLDGKIMEQVKQNFDAAFLFTYAKDKSEYYLHLSDSMRSTPNFVSNIRSYIWQQKESYWVALEFVPNGFELAGKLVRADARDIRQLIHLFSEYSKDQTTENLFKHYKGLNVQRGDFIRKPPVFVSW